MVIIKNIQIVGSVVSFEYYPEDRFKKVFLSSTKKQKKSLNI